MWVGQSNVVVAAITVLGTLFGVALGAYLNKKSVVSAAREGRVWELRRLGYSVVVVGEALEHAVWLEDGYTGNGADPHGFDTSDRCRELSRKMWGAWAECRSEFGKNRLTCSEAFASRFGEIHVSLLEIDLLTDDPPGTASSVAKCFEKAHSVLLSMALEELDLQSGEEGLATKPARE